MHHVPLRTMRGPEWAQAMCLADSTVGCPAQPMLANGVAVACRSAPAERPHAGLHSSSAQHMQLLQQGAGLVRHHAAGVAPCLLSQLLGMLLTCRAAAAELGCTQMHIAAGQRHRIAALRSSSRRQAGRQGCTNCPSGEREQSECDSRAHRPHRTRCCGGSRRCSQRSQTRPWRW